MPDPVNPQGVPAQTTPPVDPPAAPAAKPPEHSATPPRQPANPPNDFADPNQLFEYPGPDGTPVRSTLADLVEADKLRRSLGKETVEQATLLKKAQAGDKDALMKLFGIEQPGSTPPVGTPESKEDEVRRMRAELDEMRAELRRVAPTVEQIDAARETNALASLVKSQVAHVPYLGQHPNAGALVRDELSAMKARCRQDGIDPEKLSTAQQQQLVAHAMIAAEKKIEAMVAPYGVKPPVAQATPPAHPGAVNDQPEAQPGRIPAMFRFQGGQLVNEGGQSVGQTPHGTMAPIPGGVPDASTAGVGVPPAQIARPRGPMTRDGLVADLRTRVQEMNSNG